MSDVRLARIDYEDTFVRALRPGAEPTMRDILAAMATSTPRWVRAAMRVRDAIVSWLGLKTAKGLGAIDVGALAPGARVGVFRIFELGEDVAILGEDDRHLDFRLAIERRGPPAARSIAMVTTVQLHNALGRAYFAPVKRAHRLVVPAMLTALARAL